MPRINLERPAALDADEQHLSKERDKATEQIDKSADANNVAGMGMGLIKHNLIDKFSRPSALDTGMPKIE